MGKLGLGAAFSLFAVGIAGCDGIVGLGDERTLADAGVSSGGGAGFGGDAGFDGQAGAQNANNVCSVHDQGVLWAMQLGDASGQSSMATAAGNGSFYVAGFFSGALDFGVDPPLVSAGKADVFLARFDTNGHYVWSKRFGDIDDQGGTISRVLITPDSGVIFFGEFVGTHDFGDGVMRTSAGHDGFVVRYDALGNHLWTKILTSPGLDLVNDVALDPVSNKLAVAAQFAGTIVDFGGKTIPFKGGSADILLAQLDLDGNQLWSKPLGGTSSEIAQGIAITVGGRIAIAGQLDQPVDFGGGALVTVEPPDAFAAVYQPNGDFLWAKPYSGPSWQLAHRITSDRDSGDLIIAGHLGGSMSFGETPISATNGAFLARLTPTSDPVASIAVDRFFVPRALATDAQGNVIVAGPFEGITNFGGGQIATEGYQDGIVAKLGPNLEHLWTLHIGSLGYDNAWGVDTDESSNVYVAAYFQNEITLEGCGKLTSAGDADLLLIKLDK